MHRFYANENFPLPVVNELRELGIDVLTTHESGKSGQALPDEDVLSFAIKDNRAVLTFNRKHFIHIHNKLPDHLGIIVCTYDPDFYQLAKRIAKHVNSVNDLHGQLIRINRPNP